MYSVVKFQCTVVLYYMLSILIFRLFQFGRVKEKAHPGKSKEHKRKGSDDDNDDDYKPLVRKILNFDGA